MSKKYEVSESVNSLIKESEASKFADCNLQELIREMEKINSNLIELKEAKITCENVTKKHLIDKRMVSYLSINYRALKRHLRRIPDYK